MTKLYVKAIDCCRDCGHFSCSSILCVRCKCTFIRTRKIEINTFNSIPSWCPLEDVRK